MAPSEQQNSEELPNRLLLVLGIAVLVIWGLSLLLLLIAPEARGAFGDMFGAANALFSGLAFAGLIYTLILQRTELKYQRQQLKLQYEEMQNNTAELQRAARAQELSEQALRKQLATMNIAAQLNALTTMHDNYSKQLEQNSHFIRRDKRQILKMQKESAFEKIEHIFKELNKE